MCTAVSYRTKDHYFGRNMDYEFSYEESVTITPRNYPFVFRKVKPLYHHYAMIGMAYVLEEYPLYYDATNEKGLSMAGLNFPGNAVYCEEKEEKDNISPFELIPWVLGQCATIKECKELLSEINLAKIHFSKDLPLSSLHWLISDGESSITVESVADSDEFWADSVDSQINSVAGRLKIYDNPIGVLTNNPPFPMQMSWLNQYLGLSKEEPENTFSDKISLHPCSRGTGAFGMPGDLSSPSRFVRAAFTKLNAVSGESESESISQFFHILSSVECQRGCVYNKENGLYEITIYSSCCNTDKGIYYYRTYENNQITAVDMYRENLDGDTLIFYPMLTGQQISWQN